MSSRFPSGFIRPGYDPLKNPDAPTIGTATGGDASASVAFTAPGDAGGSVITAYYAVSNPGQITGTAASSPVSVTGLTNGTAYTFQVWALNSYGPGPWSAASGSVTPLDTSNRAIVAGGRDASSINVIQYFNINTTGNATDFGDLSSNLSRLSSCASTTRAVISQSITMQYITIASLGNSASFGSISPTAGEYSGSLSNSTRGVIAGGDTAGTPSNVIQYITIATTGNTTDFGDLLFPNSGFGTCASSTRGIFAGGHPLLNANKNVISYITIASTGNAIDFGDLLLTGFEKTAGCSNSTRGLIGGGDTNAINYITIATLGNSTDFGDLPYSGQYNKLSATANSTRGVFSGGAVFGTATNVICYVTIASTGDATDFGDLLSVNYDLTSTSNAHGGLQ